MSDQYIDGFPDRPGSLWDWITDTFRVSLRTKKRTTLADKQMSLSEKRTTLADKRTSLSEMRTALTERTALSEMRTTLTERTDSYQDKAHLNDVPQAEHVRKIKEYHQIPEYNPPPVDQYIHRMSANREPAQVRAEEVVSVDDDLVQVHSTHIGTVNDAITDTVLFDMPKQNTARTASPGFNHTGFSPEFDQTFSRDEIYGEVDEFLSRDDDALLESDDMEFFPETHDSFSRDNDDGPVQVRPASTGAPGEAIPDAISFGIQKPGQGAQNQSSGRQFPGRFSHRQAPSQGGFPPPRFPPPQNRRKEMDRPTRKWIPSSESVTIAGRMIGGMIYIGYSDITPHIEVAPRGADKSAKSMPYWPKYREISPQARATYLDWLAGGRSDPSYDPGYMFLYFYGLERRFLKDESGNREKREILEEVKRLKSIYSKNNSVQKYLGEFIQLAQFLLNEKIIEKQPSLTIRNSDLPLWLKVEFGTQVEQGLPFSAKQMFDWLMYHPGRHLLAPATRCPEEFRALFEIFFQDQFPDGLVAEKPRATLEYTYRAASSEFRWVLENMPGQSKIRDISHLTRPLAKAQEIANKAMYNLENFSRYIGRNPREKNSIEAHLLLPWTLRKTFPCKELEHLKAWVDDVIDKGDPVSVLDAIERIEGTRPEKPGKRNLVRMADLLNRIDCGFAPDPQFGLRSPKPDEPVILFNFGKTRRDLGEGSKLYRTALLKAALGAFVAHADGRITENERMSILVMAESTDGLTLQEHCHLASNIHWMFAVAPNLTLLKRKLKESGPETLASLRTAMITVAHADGVIQAEKVTAIEKIYKISGLDISLVYSDLHAGEANDSPAPETAGQGQGNRRKSVELDTAKIAVIQSDTEHASSILGDIFDNTSEESREEHHKEHHEESREDSSETSSEAKTGNTYPDGLDASHWQLVQTLIAREHWTEEEFGELCKKAGFMISAAVEDLNEWAYETYNDPLIEEYDGYEILSGPAEQLRKQIEGDNLLVEP